MSEHCLSAPEIDWEDVVKFDVDTNTVWNPPVSWVTRRLFFRANSIVFRLHGPFEGAAGGAVARTIANALNHYTRGPDLWPALTEAEREYINAGLLLPARPGLDDDEIPF